MKQFGRRVKRQALQSRTVLFTLSLILIASCARIPTAEDNHAPTILETIQTSVSSIHPAQIITFTITADDEDADSLTASWQTSTGTLLSSSVDSASWQAPDSTQPVQVICRITDPEGAFAADTAWFNTENRDPEITDWSSVTTFLLNGNDGWFAVNAVDPDSQDITYNWEVSCGTIMETAADSMRWMAPDSVTQAWISAVVSDGRGGEARDTVQVEVYRELGCAWVCNQGDGEVVKLSSRGAELFRVENFIEPKAVAVDAENRRLWVVDREEQLLWRLNFDGEKLDSLFIGGQPEAVAVVAQDGSCWIADSDSALVKRIAADGVTILNTVRGMTHPTALATNPWSGELWVCDRGTGAGSVYRIATDLPVETTINDTSHVRSMHGFQTPVSLSIEPESGACWLVDREAATVYRLSADLSDSLVVTGFNYPLAVAASGETGLAWVSDGGSDGTISKLFYDNIQLQISGLAWSRALAVDFNDGSCWIPETEQNRILRYSESGELLSTTSGFDYPVAISLNRGF